MRSEAKTAFQRVAGDPIHFPALECGGTKATSAEKQRLGAIIIARGSCLETNSLDCSVTNEHKPKQFCRVLEAEALLERTQRRIALSVSSGRTVIVVNRFHQRFYSPLLSEIPERNLVRQPRDRGTATAIIHGLFRLIALGQRDPVGIFPCDHCVNDDQRFMRQVETAYYVAALHPGLAVILGIPANQPDYQSGWIEPAGSIVLRCRDLSPVLHVRRLWERPSPQEVQTLRQSGGLRNSFIFVADIRALLDLFARALPRLYISFAQLLPMSGSPSESGAVERLYADLPSATFSETILSEFCSKLAVLPVAGVDWRRLS